MNGKDIITEPRVMALKEQFERLHGKGDVWLLRAPARINVLGEHVDYVSYLPTASLVFGSDRHAMVMAFRPRTDGWVNGKSTNRLFKPLSFALDVSQRPLAQQVSWEDYLSQRADEVTGWQNYVEGACRFARWRYGAAIKRGFDFIVDSTIPARAGASSSSALTVLVGAAIRVISGIDFDKAELALHSSQAEWFCGTRGGAMDHQAICLSRRGDSLLLRHHQPGCAYVDLPYGFEWVTFFSHDADKGGSVMLQYNERAAVSRFILPAVIEHLAESDRLFADRLAQAERSARGDFARTVALLQEAFERLPADISLAEMARQYPQPFAECEKLFPILVQTRFDSPLKVRQRAFHHLGEIERVTSVAEGLRRTAKLSLATLEKEHMPSLPSSHGDAEALEKIKSGREKSQRVREETHRALGRGLNASHESLRDLYEVSTPEVESLRNLILQDEFVYGARLMGGGFGGNVLAMVKRNYGDPHPKTNVDTLIERVQREFYALQGRNAAAEGAIMRSHPGDGLNGIKLKPGFKYADYYVSHLRDDLIPNTEEILG